jgi:hypothetical protein
LDHWVTRFGAPLKIISGAELQGVVHKQPLSPHNIQWAPSAPYHPQGHAHVERVNRSLQEKLSIWAASARREEWHAWLPAIAHSLNNSTHEATGRTPYELVFARKNPTPVDIDLSSLLREESEQDQLREQLREEQRFRELLRQGDIDDRRQPGRVPININEGDRVMVRQRHASVFDQQFSDPLLVIGVDGRKIRYMDENGREAVADVGDVKKPGVSAPTITGIQPVVVNLRRPRRRRGRRLHEPDVVVTPPIPGESDLTLVRSSPGDPDVVISSNISEKNAHTTL